MKRKDLADIKGKTLVELKKLAGEKKFEASKLRMGSVSGKEKNLKVYKNAQRSVAQILTVIREKMIIESLQPKMEVKGKEKA